MKRISIFVEGGGNTAGTQSVLKNGMNHFFRDIAELARTNGFSWTLAVCGPRNKAFDRFHDSRKSDEGHVFLLVDSEGAVTTTPLEYLTKTAGFKNLSRADGGHIHLMIQSMEAWIVADGAALAAFYGQHFSLKALPKASNLETVAKADIDADFKKARAKTSKAEYDKIHHATALLAALNPATVQSRCPSAARLFNELHKTIHSP